MAFNISNITGGTFTGSGGKPTNGNSGTITTTVDDSVVLWFCVTARAINSGTPDYHEVASITSSGLTITKIVDQDFTYVDSSGGGSFPNCYMHLDVFMTTVASPVTNKAWDSTMAAAADTFINDSVCIKFVVDGQSVGAPLDTNADTTSPKFDSNATGSASAPTTTNFDTDVDDGLLVKFTVGHKNNTGAPTTGLAPSGWTRQSQITSNSGAVASDLNAMVCTLEFSGGAQVNQSYADSHTEQYWATVCFALAGASVAPQPAKSPIVIIMQ